MLDKKQIPPRLPKRLLNRIIRDELTEEVLGDLQEKFYQTAKSKSVFMARLNYWYQALNYLRPFAIKKSKLFTNRNLGMYKSHFKIGYRHLLRNKWYSLINASGLAIGMAVCILIYQYVSHELSFDAFHEDHENIYRLENIYTRNGELLDHQGYSTYGLGPAAKASIPEIKEYVRLEPQDETYVVENPENNKVFQEENMWYVDDNFLSMFDFPLSSGDAELVLDGVNNIVLTEKMARKYFGNSDPTGKTLRVSAGSLSGNFTITGVLQELPQNSHIKFDALMPMNFLLKNWREYREVDNGWGWQNFVTYASFYEQTDFSKVDRKFDQIIETNVEDLEEENLELKIGLLPIADIHLKSLCFNEINYNKGNLENIRIFILIGIFLLIIAWVNYINLTTAHSMQRSKEVGVRKSIGAFQSQLMGQFLTESFLINLFAGLWAILIAMALIPTLGQLIEQEIALNLIYEWKFWMQFVAVIFLGSLISGIYPAFLTSSFDPFTLLKPSISGTKKAYIRKGLITFQFVASLFLISATYLVYEQITFMKNKDLGMDMEKILVVHGPRVILDLDKKEQTKRRKSFTNQLSRYSTVQGVSAVGSVPSVNYNWSGSAWKYGELSSTSKDLTVIFVDSNFADVFDLEFLSGEGMFSGMHWQKDGVIVNEEALKLFELGNPDEALFEKLVLPIDTVNIRGVVKDVFWTSPKHKQKAYIFAVWDYEAYYAVNVNLTNVKETISFIESSFRRSFPNDPFEYFFLDEVFDKQYNADLRFGKLLSAFTFLAVFIACLGLYGLISFSAALKIKEIGIRKVLGARIIDLVVLLFREYLKLLAIATILAIPAIHFWGNSWLENFAYRTGLGIDLFIMPSLALAIISILTVSYRIYATVQTNPVNCIRAE